MKEKKTVQHATRERDESGFWKIDKVLRLENPPMAPSDYEKVSFLSDEEKALGSGWLKRFISPAYEWGLGKGELPALDRIWFLNSWQSIAFDPELNAAYVDYFDRLVSLVTGFDGNDEIMSATTRAKGVDGTQRRNDPDARRRYGNAMLMILAIAAEQNNVYWLRMMLVVPTEREADENGSYYMSAEKAAMLTRPESSVWTDEEGLVLEFTHAVIHDGMTDALWDRAMAAWGEKEAMRNLLWIGNYMGVMKVTNALSRRKEW
ncbi:MAG: hypothetical protein HKP58_20700 [Desulfatitalea sp.]|nr:hypothetical protein [Desulfatitalea sp.]NNK02839.1 hypothetical protein [Desulfatitalea sp.]